MNHVKIFQDYWDLSISVENNYSGDQIMHTFLYNFWKGVRYSSQIAIHQK